MHRPRRPHKTDLVIVCDVSESVTSFAHFTLLLVYALRQQFARVRVFAFIDELDEVTDFFRPGADVVESVTRLAAEANVRGWYGRTDYGRAFELFNERYRDAISPRTSLLVLGDARSNYGDPGLPRAAPDGRSGTPRVLAQSRAAQRVGHRRLGRRGRRADRADGRVPQSGPARRVRA